MFVDKGQSLTLISSDGQNVNVRLEINPRAKRLILRLDEREREAVAVAPSRRHLKAAAKFAADRADWIADRLAQLPDRNGPAPGSVFSLRGQPCRISVEGPGRRAVLEAGEVQTLRLPGEVETVGRRAERYLRKAAREDLSAAVTQYCARLGVDARRVSVKDTRSRWGSCTSNGGLAFSWRLIMAPPSVLDYVAAHECAHLLEMNHSPRFWAHVARCCPDWKRERAWLRRHGGELHAVSF
ncbi:M48 family metallopeptidase [Henriciella sp.]|uniref:M48 family metallopeptidase n=1 Tax=Henriciella sp. TaxID=1968823 RepID=UPI000C11AD02|nr:SprT family zinc-dependent metalloprotease [Henriciella sp.]PHR71657.1 MAG: hypothetical protein COA64_15385 [Henriciella sp.]